MYLLFDSSAGDTVTMILSVNNKRVQYDLAAKDVSWAELLSTVLQKTNRKLNDISGLAVVVGKGRFTPTRLAVTFANTLALALSVPVVGVTDDVNFETKISAQPVGVYVSAQYSGEARIGQKK